LAGEMRSVLFLTVFVDSSETVQDHIGEPASSWRVASPSPDCTGSLYASSWRGAPTVSGVRPDLCSLDQAGPVVRFGGGTIS